MQNHNHLEHYRLGLHREHLNFPLSVLSSSTKNFALHEIKNSDV